MAKNKVFMVLHGGAGNQFFQFSAGLSLAKSGDCDVIFIYRNSGRACVVDFFEHDKKILFLNALQSRIFWIFTDILRFFGLSIVVREPHHHFWPDFFKLTSRSFFGTFFGTIVQGYWQSEKYFQKIETDIRTVFDLKKTASAAVAAESRLIGDTRDSVAVHLRFGDYLELQHIFPICQKDYFDAARKHIESRVAPQRYFIFSDDIARAQKMLDGWSRLHFIHHESLLDDMYLMHLCRHNIVANSSFSWWAAWLNRNEGKVVVAPSRYFSKCSNKLIKDLYPQNWKVI